MLRMYVDESGFGQGPVYAFGGVLSTAEKWEKFSDEWQRVLEMPGRIQHFKSDDAANFNGEFFHWRLEARAEKCRDLMSVMMDHAIGGFTLHLPHEDYANVTSNPEIKKLFKSPYFVMLYGFLRLWMENHEKLGLSGQEIDFIFDDHVMEKGNIVEAWEQFMRIERIPRRLKKLIGGLPSFQDDKKILPLQAADMIAWTARERWVASSEGRAPRTLWQGVSTPEGDARNIPLIEMASDERQLRDFYKGCVDRGPWLVINNTIMPGLGYFWNA